MRQIPEAEAIFPVKEGLFSAEWALSTRKEPFSVLKLRKFCKKLVKSNKNA
jgi:hypothetical protein